MNLNKFESYLRVNLSGPRLIKMNLPACRLTKVEKRWVRLLQMYLYIFLISSFRRVQNVVCFLFGDSPASDLYMPTFRNTLSVPSS